MTVRPGKMTPRHKVAGQQRVIAQPAVPVTLPAPVRGWVLSADRSNPPPGAALRLDNYYCTPSGLRPRAGCAKFATITDPVQSLFSYRSGGTESLFAASETAIYDITGTVDPEAAPSADVTGQTSGYYTALQFGTTGGDFLMCVNGADNLQLYNGSAWSTITGVSSPIAITGIDTSTISTVWRHAKRVWLAEAGTMSAWYLPADSVGGAATEFPLGGIFKKGGTLLCGASWSMDAGDGMDDKWVAISSEGEVAVYSGTDPASATTWSLEGVYTLPKPLGKNAIRQTGGDLLIATEVGLLPLSAALQVGVHVVDQKALSFPIWKQWRAQAAAIGLNRWEMISLPAQGLLIVSQPVSSAQDPGALVMNMQTQAWSRFTAWDTQCMAEHGGLGYFGAADGYIYRMMTGGSDAGALYTCTYLGHFEDLGARGVEKAVRQARAVFEAASPLVAQVSMNADFDTSVPSAPSSPAEFSGSLFDDAVWDTATWDATASYSNKASWQSAVAVGARIAPVVQMSWGTTGAPDLEMTAIDLEFHTGARVT